MFNTQLLSKSGTIAILHHYSSYLVQNFIYYHTIIGILNQGVCQPSTAKPGNTKHKARFNVGAYATARRLAKEESLEKGKKLIELKKQQVDTNRQCEELNKEIDSLKYKVGKNI
jgi:hypothetical protein